MQPPLSVERPAAVVLDLREQKPPGRQPRLSAERVFSIANAELPRAATPFFGIEARRNVLDAVIDRIVVLVLQRVQRLADAGPRVRGDECIGTVDRLRLERLKHSVEGDAAFGKERLHDRGHRAAKAVAAGVTGR